MTDKLPLVSIVMPSYNQSQFLEEAILSVLNQDYRNVELIIIDGGSTDGSVDVIRKYADRLAYWVSEPDQGPADAINKGLARCNGEFLGVMLSDDVLCFDAISRKVTLFKARPDLDFIYGDIEQMDMNGNRLFVRYSNDLPYREWVRTCTMPVGVHSSLWRRSVMERVGGFRLSMGVATDWDFFLRVGLQCRMKYLPGIAGKFRCHPNSQSMNKQLLWTTLVPQMYEEYFARNDLPKEIQVLKREALANAHLYAADLLLDHASLRAMVKELIRALTVYPPILFSRRFGKLVLLCVGGQSLTAMAKKIGRKLLPREDHMRWDVTGGKAGEVIIDIGCGHGKNKAVWGIDVLFEVHPDIVADLEQGLPLADNSVDCVYANHFLEHVENLEAVLSEIHRVLKPDGRCRLFVPHFSNPYSYSDYTHRRLFGAVTFRYFTPTHFQRFWRKVPNYQSGFPFDVTYERLRFYSPLILIWPLVVCLEIVVNGNEFIRAFYEYHFCYLFPIYGIQVEMRPVDKVGTKLEEG